MLARGIRQAELCRLANISESQLLRAVELDSDGFPETLEILRLIATELQRDLNWLITGVGDSPFPIPQPEQVYALVFDYFEVKPAPKSQKTAVLNYIQGKLNQLTVPTARAAYRSGIPRTVSDVARIYDELFPNG
jgi:transcriptional regulator with XRE-family HTH domain